MVVILVLLCVWDRLRILFKLIANLILGRARGSMAAAVSGQRVTTEKKVVFTQSRSSSTGDVTQEH